MTKSYEETRKEVFEFAAKVMTLLEAVPHFQAWIRSSGLNFYCVSMMHISNSIYFGYKAGISPEQVAQDLLQAAAAQEREDRIEALMIQMAGRSGFSEVRH
jgi:hypothetical protein